MEYEASWVNRARSSGPGIHNHLRGSAQSLTCQRAGTATAAWACRESRHAPIEAAIMEI
jgi:hypothetical protein